MSLMQEFKEFAVKGNMMDMAVGIIIGGAFAKIVDSLVKDVIMPLVAFLMGGELDFKNLYVVLGTVPEGTADTFDALKEAGVPLLAYGNFITILINFIILAFIIFMLIKGMNNLRRQKEAEEAAAPEEPKADPEDIALLKQIRDALQK